VIRRDWSAARLKLEDEGRCRVCQRGDVKLDAAHVIGRFRDPEVRPGVRRVDPDAIVPLCGPAVDSDTCHGRYDAHRLDLLPHLTVDEQVRAVQDAGGLEAARRRITGERGCVQREPAPEGALRF
jgi:hypothetical protein